MIDGRQPRILVTGATGFLGQALVRRLAVEGRPVRAAAGPTSAPRGEEMRLDLRSDRDIGAAVKDVDTIIHLAAVSALQAGRDADAAAEVNALGTFRLARAAAQAGVTRVVMLSTHAVYADQPGLLHEDAALAPHGIYAASKLAAEALAAGVCSEAGMACSALRCFNLYGPGAPAHNVVERFTQLANAGTPISLSAPADRAIDLLHVDDAADALVQLLQCATWPATVNLGSGVGTPLTQLVAAIGFRLSRTTPIEHLSAAAPYRHDRVASIGRLRALLPDFRPRPLAEGLTAPPHRNAA